VVKFIDREGLAWAAGFYDGEGCTSGSANKVGKFQVHVVVVQKDIRVLVKFQTIVGVGTIYGPYKSTNCYRFDAYGFEKAQAVVCMLWPWLSEIKREQAKGALLRARST
jgi:hypothetical protein